MAQVAYISKSIIEKYIPKVIPREFIGLDLPEPIFMELLKHKCDQIHHREMLRNEIDAKRTRSIETDDTLRGMFT